MPSDDAQFYALLQQFLFTAGRKFQADLLFDGPLNPCDRRTPKLTSVSVEYTHLK